MTCQHLKRLCYTANRNACAHDLNTTVAVPVFCACMIAAQGAIAGMDYMRLSQPYQDRDTEGIRSMPQLNIISDNNNQKGLCI